MEFALFYLCTKIFCGRKRGYATIIGFIDVVIWFLVVREALNTDIKSIWIALAYAGGYAAGTFTGSSLSKRVIKGTVGVQVITKNIRNSVIKAIKESGFSATYVECKGIHKEDTNYLIGAQVDNKRLGEFKDLIMSIDENAFITVTESKEIMNGYFGK